MYHGSVDSFVTSKNEISTDPNASNLIMSEALQTMTV